MPPKTQFSPGGGSVGSSFGRENYNAGIMPALKSIARVKDSGKIDDLPLGTEKTVTQLDHKYNMKPGKTNWKGVQTLPWRCRFDEAQSDLNVIAKLKGWNEV